MQPGRLTRGSSERRATYLPARALPRWRLRSTRRDGAALVAQYYMKEVEGIPLLDTTGLHVAVMVERVRGDK